MRYMQIKYKYLKFIKMIAQVQLYLMKNGFPYSVYNSPTHHAERIQQYHPLHSKKSVQGQKMQGVQKQSNNNNRSQHSHSGFMHNSLNFTTNLRNNVVDEKRARLNYTTRLPVVHDDKLNKSIQIDGNEGKNASNIANRDQLGRYNPKIDFCPLCKNNITMNKIKFTYNTPQKNRIAPQVPRESKQHTQQVSKPIKQSLKTPKIDRRYEQIKQESPLICQTVQIQTQQEIVQKKQEKQDSKIKIPTLTIIPTQSIKIDEQFIDSHEECKHKIEETQKKYELVLEKEMQKINHKMKKIFQKKLNQKFKSVQSKLGKIDDKEDILLSESEANFSETSSHQEYFGLNEKLGGLLGKFSEYQKSFEEHYLSYQEEVEKELIIKNAQIQQITAEVEQITVKATSIKKQNTILIEKIQKLQNQLNESKKKSPPKQVLQSIKQESPIVVDLQNFHGDDEYEQIISELHKVLKIKQKQIKELKKEVGKLQAKITQIQDNYISQKQLETLHNVIQEHQNQLLAEGGTIYDKLNNTTYNYFNGKVFENQLIYELKKDNKKLIEYIIEQNTHTNVYDEQITQKFGRMMRNITLKEENMPTKICQEAVRKIQTNINNLLTKFGRVLSGIGNNNMRPTTDRNNQDTIKINGKNKSIDSRQKNGMIKNGFRNDKNGPKNQSNLYDNAQQDLKVCQVYLKQVSEYITKLLNSKQQKHKKLQKNKTNNITHKQQYLLTHRSKNPQQEKLSQSSKIRKLQETIKRCEKQKQQISQKIQKYESANMQSTIKILTNKNQELQYKLNKQIITNRSLLLREEELSKQVKLWEKKERMQERVPIIQQIIKKDSTLQMKNIQLAEQTQTLRQANQQLTIRNREFIKKLQEATSQIFSLNNELSETKFLLNRHKYRSISVST